MHRTTAACAIACVAIASAGAVAAFPQASAPTQHNDNARTGANPRETVLKPSNVNKDHFGKLAFRLVDGNVYAQPLVIAQAKVADHGATNVVLVATEHNSVYAFDADDVGPNASAAQLWHTGPDVIGLPVDSSALYASISAPQCVDLTTEIGITGTPAIQITKDAPPREGVVFVAAKSMGASKYVYRLISLDLASGAILGSVDIEASVPGSGNGSTGVGAGAMQVFRPQLQLNRPGLLVVGHVLYVAFGGHCDVGKYHGWLLAYDISNPKAMKRIAAFCTTPNGRGPQVEGRAGIWMSGQGAAADDAGNVYFVSSDGTYDGTTDFGDSVVKVKVAGGAIQVQDWFTPQNQQLLKEKDVDLGSAGVVLVPGSHMLIAGGKEGRLYLIDRDKMGKGVATSLQSFQVTHAPDLPHYYNLHGTPVVWARPGEIFVYTSGEEDHVKQFRLVADATGGGSFASTQPFKTSVASAPYPNFPTGQFGQANRDEVWMPGGAMSLSSNGGADGILWVAMPFAANGNQAVVRGVLRAFDASDVSKDELWDSENTGNEKDRLGQFAKFCPPTVANGKVYVATFQQEIIGHDGVHRKLEGGDQPALAIYGPR
jgi:hypothetical protein